MQTDQFKEKYHPAETVSKQSQEFWLEIATKLTETAYITLLSVLQAASINQPS